MRRLIAIEFLSVDGVMQGLGSPDEDRDGGFEHGGWGAPYAEAIHESQGADGLRGTSAYLFGRNTFEKMAGFWPHQGMENPIAAHMNSTPKYVVSRTLSTVDWAHSTLLSGEVNDEVRALKSSGTGDLAILGSGQLVRALMRAELLDGLRLFIHPLVIGSGKQLFGDLDSPRTLRLVNSKTTSMGTLVLSYDLGR